MENVYIDKRPRGNYRVRVRVTTDDGVIATSTTYYPDPSLTDSENMAAAEALAVAFIEEVRREHEEEKEKRNPTFRQFYSEVYLDKAKTEIADTTYEFNVNTNEKFFLPTFGDIKLKVINKKMLQDKIQELVNKENENLEDPRPILPQTVERYVSPFRAVISMAVREGILDRDPFEGGMKYPKMYLPVITCMDKDDYAALMAVLNSCIRGEIPLTKTEVIIAIGLLSGLRRGEIVALQWGDLENLIQGRLDRCRICVNASATKVKGEEQKRADPKSINSKRTFVVPELLAEVLLKWKSDNISRGVSVCDNDYIITGRKSGMVSLGTPGRWVTQFVEDYNKQRDETAQIECVKLHSFRHTFASVLVRTGMDIETIREIMGHDDICTTQIYMYSFKLQEDNLMGDVNTYNNELIARIGEPNADSIS